MPSLQTVATCMVVAIAYFVSVLLYRLFFHPLANFPGPKLAAATFWYEFYYDAVKQGQYIFKIKEMHDRYGAIIRISPTELHANDPNFIPTLYTGGSKRRDKYHRFLRLFGGGSESTITSVSHDVHRIRRGSINRFLSKERVRQLEPVLQRNFQKLLDRIGEYRMSKTAVDLNLPFGAYTCDIIMEYSFGEANSSHWLDKPEYYSKFFEMMRSVHMMVPLAKQLPWLMPLMDRIPENWLEKGDEGMRLFIHFKNQMIALIDDVKAKRGRGGKVLSGNALTVFDNILDSKLPEHELATERLWKEAQVIVIAGTETTAWTLSVITYYLLENPATMQRLRKVLEEAIPDLAVHVGIRELEQIPFLTAVIQEGLRLAMGVSHRLPRIAPDENLQFSDRSTLWSIPAGTPISMSCGLIHFNSTIFSSPYSFLPDRFLQDEHLDRYLLSFSKGSRQCAGINFAYTQLYLCVSGLFRRYGAKSCPGPEGYLELFETDRGDVELRHDFFVPYGRMGSKGIRVTVEK